MDLIEHAGWRCEQAERRGVLTTDSSQRLPPVVRSATQPSAGPHTQPRAFLRRAWIRAACPGPGCGFTPWALTSLSPIRKSIPRTARVRRTLAFAMASLRCRAGGCTWRCVCCFRPSVPGLGDFLFYPVGEACDECALPARTTHARRRMLTLPGPS